MLDKTAIKNNKKFLISCADPFLAEIFINECMSVYSDYELKKCHSSGEFVDTLNGGSLFDSNKKIICLMCLSDDNIQDIEPFLDYDVEDVIILVESGTLKKNKGYIKIKSEYSYQKLEKIPERDCRSWLYTYMIKEGLKFAPEVPAFIISKRGSDLRSLTNEVKKLKYLNREITENLCSNIICDADSTDFFKFIDNFGHKRISESLLDFNKVDESKYTQLLHFMIGHVEKLYKIAIYRSQKKTAEEISDLIGLPKFILQTKYFTSISIYSKIKLLKILDLLNDLDLKLRLSKFDNKLIFESYLMKVFKL
jgi:DNA polymerase III delta subunit